MKLLSLLRWGCVLGFWLGAFALASRAADEGLGVPVGTITVPEGFKASEVKAVLVTSLVAREWSVKEQTGDRVVGYLNHRGNEATITLVYDAKQIVMHCVGWKTDRNGQRVKPEMPDGWIKNLQKDIPKRLVRAGATK